jgi:hypothetical protein
MSIDYAYLEKTEQYINSGSDPYQLSPEIARWIAHELEKRVEQLYEKQPEHLELEHLLEVYRTLRTHMHLPVFVIGYREEEHTVLLEAWHFAIRPPSNSEVGVQFVLDRVPLHLFQDGAAPRV